MPLRTPGSTRQTFSLTRYRRSRLCTRYLTRHHMLPTIPLSLCGEKRGECTVVITSNARVVRAPHVHTRVSVNLFMCKKCKCLNYGVSVSRSFWLLIMPRRLCAYARERIKNHSTRTSFLRRGMMHEPPIVAGNFALKAFRKCDASPSYHNYHVHARAHACPRVRTQE